MSLKMDVCLEAIVENPDVVKHTNQLGPRTTFYDAYYVNKYASDGAWQQH
jgi:hypothetical protein